MRKIALYLFIFFFLSPLSALGATKNVTITWAMSDTSNVQGYKMYYSYSSNMADKQLACQTSNTTATTLTCKNVALNQSPAYFVIAALIAGDEVDSTASAESFVSSITPVQGFQIETTAIPPANNPGTQTESIGNNTLYQSGEGMWKDQAYAYKLPNKPAHSGQLTSISIGMSGITGARHFRAALYNHNEANNTPGSLIPGSLTVEGVTIADSTYRWYTLNIENGMPHINAGTQYWIVIESTDNYGSFSVGATNNGEKYRNKKNIPNYAWPDWNGSADGYRNKAVAAYFTYTY